jgi:hypothetical protein
MKQLLVLLTFLNFLSACEQTEPHVDLDQKANLMSDTLFLNYTMDMSREDFLITTAKNIRDKKLVLLTDKSIAYPLKINGKVAYGVIEGQFYKDTLANLIVKYESSVNNSDLLDILMAKYGNVQPDATYDYHKWSRKGSRKTITLEDYVGRKITYSDFQRSINLLLLNLDRKKVVEDSLRAAAKKDF